MDEKDYIRDCVDAQDDTDDMAIIVADIMEEPEPEPILKLGPGGRFIIEYFARDM